MQLNHPKLTIGVALAVLVILIIWGVTSQNKPSNSAGLIDESRETTFVSPLTGSTNTILIDQQTSSGDANEDAVTPTYTLADATSLTLPREILHEFLEEIPNLIAREITPTFAKSYIQIDQRTVKCDSKYDCSMSFYIDSPERYFYYRSYLKPNGESAAVLRQEPLPGVTL